jgi:o-succinylbenzoate---CoA ligase
MLTINGSRYSSDELLALCKQKIDIGQKWEQELYAFIQLWGFGKGAISLQTSGSTGLPKTVLFERSAFEASAMATISFFGLKPHDKVLLCLPAQYVAARLMVVRAFVGQLDLIIMEPTGNPLSVLTQVIDFAALVPLQVKSAIDANPDAFRLVRQLIIGGSAVSPSLKEKLGDVPSQCWETYGMTETLTHVAVKAINGMQKSDVFTALPGVLFSVDDRNCLVVDAPRIASSSIVTNDVVLLMGSNRFEFQGRVDSVINSGGVKIHPEMVTAKIASFFDKPFELVGIADERLGQRIVMVVEGGIDGIDFELLFTNCGLEKYERPKQIFSLAAFPRSAAGKVLRQELLLLLH